MKPRPSNRDKAGRAWGVDLPEWVVRLAEACDAHGVRGTAARLTVSPALLSLAINHKHHSSYGFVERRVHAILMAEILECPALGLISTAQCREEQNTPFISVNPLAVAVYRACRNGCRHYLKNREEDHAAQSDSLRGGKAGRH